MAIVQLPVPDTDTTVLRPIVFDIVRELMERTFISPDTEIRYGGVFKDLAQPTNNVGPVRKEDNQFGHQPSIDIEVTTSGVGEMANSNNQYQINNPAIFYDDQVGVVIRPDYRFTEIQLTMRITGRSRTEMKLWRDELHNRLGEGRQVFLHRAKYAYHFPAFVSQLLKQIHTMREAVAPYNETFQEYLQNFFSPKVTEVTNGDKSYTTLMVTESLREFKGWFDFPLESEESEKSENKANEEITVRYIAQLDFVSSMHVQYPIVVHNQLLPSRFRQSESSMQAENTGEGIYSYTNSQNNYFTTKRLHERNRMHQGYAFPEFDDFVPSMVLQDTDRIITTLVKLDTESREGRFFNLAEIPGFTFDPRVLEFMRTEAPYMTGTYKSIFQIHLYEGDMMLVPRDTLYVRSDLDVRSKIKTSYRKVYHVRLSIVNDLNVLDPDAIDRLPPGLIDDILKDLYPDMKVCFIDPDNPTPEEIQRLLAIMRTFPRGARFKHINCDNVPPEDWWPETQPPTPKTAGGFWIRALREEKS